MTATGTALHTVRQRRSSAALWLAAAGVLSVLSAVAWFTIGWFAPVALFTLAALCYLVGLVQTIRRR